MKMVSVIAATAKTLVNWREGREMWRGLRFLFLRRFMFWMSGLGVALPGSRIALRDRCHHGALGEVWRVVEVEVKTQRRILSVMDVVGLP